MQCTKKTLTFKEQNELREYAMYEEEIFLTPALRPKKSRKEILESPINLYKLGDGESLFCNSDEESGPQHKMKVYDQMDLTSVVRNSKRVKTIKLVSEVADELPCGKAHDKLTQTKDDESPLRFKYEVEKPTWDFREHRKHSILDHMSSKGDFKYKTEDVDYLEDIIN